MNKKPVMSPEHFISRVTRMKEGMLKHRNDTSTVNNLLKMFTDRLASTMSGSTLSAYKLRVEFAKFFIHDNVDDHKMAARCLQQACEKMVLEQDDRNRFLTLICNALSESVHPDVQKAISRIKPFGWMKPQVPMKKVA